MIKANKTEEQKVDLLKKNVSHKIRDLVLTLSHKLGDADYNGWSEQMDVFAHNLQNHNHQAKLNNTSNYCPSNNTISPQPPPLHMDNKLCLACRQPGHWT